MAERQAGEMQEAQAATDSYIQQVASKGNPADQIATAKGLLDDGTITQARVRPAQSISPRLIRRPVYAAPVRPHGGEPSAPALAETQLATSTNSIGPTANRQFLKQRSHMRLDRVQGQDEIRRDLLV